MRSINNMLHVIIAKKQKNFAFIENVILKEILNTFQHKSLTIMHTIQEKFDNSLKLCIKTILLQYATCFVLDS